MVMDDEQARTLLTVLVNNLKKPENNKYIAGICVYRKSRLLRHMTLIKHGVNKVYKLVSNP